MGCSPYARCMGASGGERRGTDRHCSLHDHRRRTVHYANAAQARCEFGSLEPGRRLGAWAPTQLPRVFIAGRTVARFSGGGHLEWNFRARSGQGVCGTPHANGMVMNSKSLISLFVVALWPLTTATLVHAQSVIVQSKATSDAPQAVVVSIHGTCDYSADGATFTKLKAYHPLPNQGPAVRTEETRVILYQGAVVRTGEDAQVDLFFRKIGTSVRLQPNTEVKLEEMTRSTQAGVSEMHTLLNLPKGRIFVAVRSLIPGSTFAIRNAAGRSVVEGGGSGRYIITADGTQVADKSSRNPLKVMGDTGITVVAPGQSFSAKEGKMLPVTAPEAVKALIAYDELDALTEEASQPPVVKQHSRKY